MLMPAPDLDHSAVRSIVLVIGSLDCGGAERVLADMAEHKEEIDVAAARAELEAAMKGVGSIMAGAADPAVALDQAMRAQARVDAATK